MFIIAWIAKALIARNVSARAAGPLSWVISIIGAGLLIFAGWSLIKHGIISQHDSAQRAKALEQQLDRTNKADQADAGLEKRDADNDQTVKGAIDDAIRKDPNAGTGAAGPVSNAAVDELRRSRRQRQHAPAH